MENKEKKSNLPRLPTLDLRKGVGLPDRLRRLVTEVDGQRLPNASIIYSIGAGLLVAMALYSLFTGAWFTALILLIPAGALVGFAVYYLGFPPTD